MFWGSSRCQCMQRSRQQVTRLRRNLVGLSEVTVTWSCFGMPKHRFKPLHTRVSYVLLENVNKSRLICCWLSQQKYSNYTVVHKPDRQWRSSSFQEFKKVRVSRDLWPWTWPWAHPGCTLTWSPSCESLVAIRPFAWDREEAICAKVYRQTDGQTDRRRTPRHCISSFLESANKPIWTESERDVAPLLLPLSLESYAQCLLH